MKNIKRRSFLKRMGLASLIPAGALTITKVSEAVPAPLTIDLRASAELDAAVNKGVSEAVKRKAIMDAQKLITPDGEIWEIILESGRVVTFAELQVRNFDVFVDVVGGEGSRLTDVRFEVRCYNWISELIDDPIISIAQSDLPVNPWADASMQSHTFARPMICVSAECVFHDDEPMMWDIVWR